MCKAKTKLSMKPMVLLKYSSNKIFVLRDRLIEIQLKELFLFFKLYPLENRQRFETIPPNFHQASYRKKRTWKEPPCVALRDNIAGLSFHLDTEAKNILPHVPSQDHQKSLCQRSILCVKRNSVLHCT